MSKSESNTFGDIKLLAFLIVACSGYSIGKGECVVVYPKINNSIRASTLEFAWINESNDSTVELIFLGQDANDKRDTIVIPWGKIGKIDTVECN